MKRIGRPPARRQEPPGETPDEMMTIRQVADYLLCHPSTIYRLVNTGGMPGFRLGGGWRFKRSLIDEWMREAGRRSLRKESLRETKE